MACCSEALASKIAVKFLDYIDSHFSESGVCDLREFALAVFWPSGLHGRICVRSTKKAQYEALRRLRGGRVGARGSTRAAGILAVQKGELQKEKLTVSGRG